MAEMQYQFPGVSEETKSLMERCKKNFRFEPLRYTHLEPRPDWWLVRPEEIIEICRSVKKGRTEIIAESAAGLPVYAGPTEGTALGNLAAQMIALGEFSDLAAFRAALPDSFPIETYLPRS